MFLPTFLLSTCLLSQAASSADRLQEWRRRLQELDSVIFSFDRFDGQVCRSGRWWTDGWRHRCEWGGSEKVYSSATDRERPVFAATELPSRQVFDGTRSFSMEQKVDGSTVGWVDSGFKVSSLVKRVTPPSLWLNWMGYPIREIVDKESEYLQVLDDAWSLDSGLLNLRISLHHPRMEVRDRSSYCGELVLSIDPSRGFLIENAWIYEYPSSESLPSSVSDPLPAELESPYGDRMALELRMKLVEAGQVGDVYYPRVRQMFVPKSGSHATTFEIREEDLLINVLKDEDFVPRFTKRDRITDKTTGRVLLGDAPVQGAPVPLSESALEDYLGSTGVARRPGTSDLEAEPGSSSCSELCLYLAHRLLGKDSGLKQVRAAFGNETQSAVRSFEDLMAASSVLGADCRAWDLDFDNLEATDGRAILIVHRPQDPFYPEGHFYVLDRRSPTEVWVLDPPTLPVRLYGLEPLRQRWSGAVLAFGDFEPSTGGRRWPVLLLASSGISLLAWAFSKRRHRLSRGVVIALAIAVLWSCSESSANGTRLVEVEPAVLDLGRVEQVAESCASVRICNRSDSSVELGEVSRSCNCLAAKLSKTRLQPGESCDLEIRVSLTGNPGPRLIKASVSTDASREPLVLLVRADLAAVEGPRLDREQVVFTFLGPGPDLHADAQYADLVWVDPPACLVDDPTLPVRIESPEGLFAAVEDHWRLEVGKSGVVASRRITVEPRFELRPVPGPLPPLEVVVSQGSRTSHTLVLQASARVKGMVPWDAEPRVLKFSSGESRSEVLLSGQFEDPCPAVECLREDVPVRVATMDRVDEGMRLTFERSAPASGRYTLPLRIRSSGRSATMTLEVVCE